MGEKDEWHAYWWGDQMYAVAHALEALNEFAPWMQIDRSVTPLDKDLRRSLSTRINALNKVWRTRMPANDLPLDSFAVALRLKAAIFGGGDRDDISYAASSLVNLQQSDGRWRGEEKLRVTDPSLERPWEHEDAGPLFADMEDIFTTATVLDALQGMLRRTQAL
jgi:hypothetical protein